MAVTQTTVTGPIYIPNLTKPENAKIVFELSSWDREEGEATFVTGPFVGVIDENGDFSVNLFTTTEGTNQTVYHVSVTYLTMTGKYTRECLGTVALSGPGPYNLADLNFVDPNTTASFDILAEIKAYNLQSMTAAQTTEDYKNEVEAYILSLTSSNANSISDLSTTSIDKPVEVFGYYTDSNIGGGVFRWDTTIPKSNHNGGTIISNTVPFNGLQDFVDGVGETDPSGSGAWIRDVGNSPCLLEWFGAKGDNTHDDSISAKAAYQAGFRNFQLLQAEYYFASRWDVSDKFSLIGYPGQSLIRGGIRYSETEFPTSADTDTSLVFTDNGFYMYGVSIGNHDTSQWDLEIISNYSGGFEDVFYIHDCHFYGANGLRSMHGYNSSITGCVFNNRSIGCQMLGSTNISYTDCRWNNCNNVGVDIGWATDNNARKGGELHKFVSCQFAVCSTGIKALVCRWLTIDNVLLDYCGLPLEFNGCADWAIAQTYAGASNTAVSQFTGNPGFVAPITGSGIAFYALPYTDPSGGIYVNGGVCTGNRFVFYGGGTNPVVYMPDPSTANYGTNRLQMTNNTFFVPTGDDHSMPHFMVVKDATNVSIVGNYFKGIKNTSGSMISQFSLPGVDTENLYAAGNKTRDLLSNGSPLGPTTYEQPDFLGYGALNAQFLHWRNAANQKKQVFGVDESDRTIIKTVSDTSVLRVVNESGTTIMEITPTGFKMLVSGTLKEIGQAPENSAGSGFRNLIITN